MNKKSGIVTKKISLNSFVYTENIFIYDKMPAEVMYHNKN